jgi:hypothetical protein
LGDQRFPERHSFFKIVEVVFFQFFIDDSQLGTTVGLPAEMISGLKDIFCLTQPIRRSLKQFCLILTF